SRGHALDLAALELAPSLRDLSGPRRLVIGLREPPLFLIDAPQEPPCHLRPLGRWQPQGFRQELRWPPSSSCSLLLGSCRSDLRPCLPLHEFPFSLPRSVNKSSGPNVAPPRYPPTVNLDPHCAAEPGPVE